MFWKVFLLLTVRAYVASTIHVRVNNDESPSTTADVRRRRSDKAGNSNAWCNSRASQRTTPFTCSSKSDGLACLDVASVIRRTCRKCEDAKLMTPSQSTRCHEITQKNVDIEKGVKVYCNRNTSNANNNDYHRHLNAFERDNCAFLSVTKGGAPTWSVWGTEQICPCVNKFVNDCKEPKDSNKPWKYGLSCMLKKIEECPKVCPELKSRINAAKTASLMEAKVENELKDRASVLVDAHGKTSRNASASILSLDHSMSGKCSQ